jgi:hypothetical protein
VLLRGVPFRSLAGSGNIVSATNCHNSTFGSIYALGLCSPVGAALRLPCGAPLAPRWRPPDRHALSQLWVPEHTEHAKH